MPFSGIAEPKACRLNGPMVFVVPKMRGGVRDLAPGAKSQEARTSPDKVRQPVCLKRNCQTLWVRQKEGFLERFNSRTRAEGTGSGWFS
jgi:hypothetical protein